MLLLGKSYIVLWNRLEHPWTLTSVWVCWGWESVLGPIPCRHWRGAVEFPVCYSGTVPGSHLSPLADFACCENRQTVSRMAYSRHPRKWSSQEIGCI